MEHRNRATHITLGTTTTGRLARGRHGVRCCCDGAWVAEDCAVDGQHSEHQLVVGTVGNVGHCADVGSVWRTDVVLVQASTTARPRPPDHAMVQHQQPAAFVDPHRVDGLALSDRRCCPAELPRTQNNPGSISERRRTVGCDCAATMIEPGLSFPSVRSAKISDGMYVARQANSRPPQTFRLRGRVNEVTSPVRTSDCRAIERHADTRPDPGAMPRSQI